jgi:hypothetical protein
VPGAAGRVCAAAALAITAHNSAAEPIANATRDLVMPFRNLRIVWLVSESASAAPRHG